MLTVKSMNSTENMCPRCGETLQPGKAIFSIGQLLKGAAWVIKPKPPELKDCLKCGSCGYSEIPT